MPQSEDDPGDRTTFLRREESLRFNIADEFGHYLVVLSGSGVGNRLQLQPAGLIIGRDGQCGFVVASPDVSRRHCRIDLKGSEVIATDLNSTNGTYMDGKRIREPTPV